MRYIEENIVIGCSFKAYVGADSRLICSLIINKHAHFYDSKTLFKNDYPIDVILRHINDERMDFQKPIGHYEIY